MAYEPAPLDPVAVLDDLRGVTLPRDAPSADPQGTYSVAELTSFALTHNPALRELRAQVPVSESLLVEAGLLPDLEVGWDGMDALAAQITENTVSSTEFLAGFGFSVPLLRPGELGARQDLAEHELAEVRALVVAGEWEVARAVALACEEVLAAERALAANRAAVEVARRTFQHFEQAGAAGAATAVEVSLARGALLTVQADALDREARVETARQGLNALLGLPPGVEARPRAASAEESVPELPLGEVVQDALGRRPDLAAARAAYEAAEADLRLEVVRQRPGVSIGTGITLDLGLFNDFNGAAIETALARRHRVGERMTAMVHEVRRDVHASSARLRAARAQLDFTEDEVLGNADETLRLIEDAFAAGEATLLEVLAAQRGQVDAATRYVTAQADVARARWELLAASGLLLTPDSPSPTPAQEVPSR